MIEALQVRIAERRARRETAADLAEHHRLLLPERLEIVESRRP